jgi:hypothetical protein
MPYQHVKVTAVDSATAQLATLDVRGGLRGNNVSSLEKPTMAKDRSPKGTVMPGGVQRLESL